jgi:hypothetical protein
LNLVREVKLTGLPGAYLGDGYRHLVSLHIGERQLSTIGAPGGIDARSNVDFLSIL